MSTSIRFLSRLVIFGLMLFTLSAVAQINPNKVAILHWWDVNQGNASIHCCTDSPRAMYFDGKNMWVSDHINLTLGKVRASDGKILLTVGSDGQSAITSDGENIWVGEGEDGGVEKFRESDGTLLGNFPIQPGSLGAIDGIAFDGTFIWVATGDYIKTSQPTLVKLRVSDGAVVGTVQVAAGANYLAFDGANLWTTGNNAVTKVRASDGAILGTFTVSNGAFGLAFDGSHMWVVGNGAVTELNAATGTLMGTFSIPGGFSIAFDGINMWIPDSNSPVIARIRVSDGASTSFPLPTTEYFAAFDGANVWVSGSALLKL